MNEAANKHGRPDFARLRGTPYLAIAVQIEEAINEGVFVPGDRLPSQRSIADDLGFHLNTVNGVFREVARRGPERGNAGRGTVVIARENPPVSRRR